MMEHRRYEPPGYLSKKAAAERLGISTKTLDRRMKTDNRESLRDNNTRLGLNDGGTT